MIRALVKAGQSLTRSNANMSIPGRCSRWGCLLEVGQDSTFGPGPVCLVCSEQLRPVGLTPEENEKCRRINAQ